MAKVPRLTRYEDFTKATVDADTVHDGVIKCKRRSSSSLPDFIRANGDLTATIEASVSNPLTLRIKNVSYTFQNNISITGLQVAPSTNNTALVNEVPINGLYEGEDGQNIQIDNEGSEITNRIGEFIALKNNNEIMYVLNHVSGSTIYLTNAYRGFFFDTSGTPIYRESLTDNTVLTLMNLGRIFVDIDGNVDVSYKQFKKQKSEPSLPSINDYWFDENSNSWKKYNGSSWQETNSTYVGMVVLDDTSCIASRSADISQIYSSENTMELNQSSFTNEDIYTRVASANISVYGKNYNSDEWKNWNITTDLESGYTESANTIYYLYISEDGDTIISPEKPHWRTDLGGADYHPYESWRMVGMVYNNSGSNFLTTWSEVGNFYYKSGTGTRTSTGSWGTIPNQSIDFLTRGRSDYKYWMAPDSEGPDNSNISIGGTFYARVLYDGNQRCYTTIAEGGGGAGQPSAGTLEVYIPRPTLGLHYFAAQNLTGNAAGTFINVVSYVLEIKHK